MAPFLVHDVVAFNTYLLAEKNAQYPFRSANQFTRHSPFLLIFVLHPWLNQLAIHNDFSNSDSTFTRTFARRAFMQFTHDVREISTVCKEISRHVTLGEASHLLSGIMFLNVWPFESYPNGSTESKPVPSWIYLNPRATNKITWATLRTFISHNVIVDDFTHDDY